MNSISKEARGFLAAIALIVIVTAIYAVTTWNQTSNSSYSIKSAGRSESQLPNPDKMTPSLQAEPDNSGIYSGSGSSTQLQPTTAPTDNTGVNYPDCRGAQLDAVSTDVMMCQAQ